MLVMTQLRFLAAARTAIFCDGELRDSNTNDSLAFSYLLMELGSMVFDSQ